MNLENLVMQSNLPEHVAVIMDGNRRWAKKHLMPVNYGHREGALRVKDLVRTCVDMGIKYLTIYTFSTENWGREKKEVDYLMGLLVEFIKKELNYLNENNVKVTLLGNIDDLPEDTKNEVKRSIELTKNNTKLTLNIALSYGSRTEITDAVKKVIADYENNKINIDEINEESFKRYLYTNDIPDPDLLIRTSGEIRLSNFLLYQLAYTELYFTDVMWPEFNKEEFLKAINSYQTRKRRYGKN